MIIKIVLYISVISSYFFINNKLFPLVLLIFVILYEMYNKIYYQKKYSIIKKIIDSPNLEDIEIDYQSKDIRKISENLIALISQLKIREQKLIYDSEYIESLLEILDGVFITISETNYIVAVNKFFLKVLKIEEKEVIGKLAAEVEYIKEITEYINEHEEEKNGELEINDRIFEFKYRILKGNLKDKIVFIRDVTKARDLEQIKMEMQKREALKDFAYGVTHEIRNPLTPIKGLIQLLRAELSKNEKSSKYMDMVFKEIDRLDKKIDKLDRFIEDDRHNKENVLIDDLLEEIVNEFKGKEENKEKYLNISFEGKLKDVEMGIDREKFKEAFENILKNSYEAVEKYGEIKVFTYEREGRKIIKITDNGKGMSEDSIKKISNPLYTTKFEEKAMGMGLPIACKIINNHNGSIQFNSEYNKGTEIRIIFN